MIAPSAPRVYSRYPPLFWGYNQKYDVAHIDAYQSVCGINVVTLQRE